VSKIEQARVAFNNRDLQEAHDKLIEASSDAGRIAAATDDADTKRAWDRIGNNLGIGALALGRGASSATTELINSAASQANEAVRSCG
jgi:hypothetical protein